VFLEVLTATVMMMMTAVVAAAMVVVTAMVMVTTIVVIFSSHPGLPSLSTPPSPTRWTSSLTRMPPPDPYNVSLQ